MINKLIKFEYPARKGLSFELVLQILVAFILVIELFVSKTS